jgi:hypothetical protein
MIFLDNIDFSNDMTYLLLLSSEGDIGGEKAEIPEDFQHHAKNKTSNTRATSNFSFWIA